MSSNKRSDKEISRYICRRVSTDIFARTEPLILSTSELPYECMYGRMGRYCIIAVRERDVKREPFPFQYFLYYL